MAEFCKNCIEKVMGLKPDDEMYTYWLTTDGICEECGYKHLDSVAQAVVGDKADTSTPCINCNSYTKSVRIGRAKWLCEICEKDKTLSDIFYLECLERQSQSSPTSQTGLGIDNSSAVGDKSGILQSAETYTTIGADKPVSEGEQLLNVRHSEARNTHSTIPKTMWHYGTCDVCKKRQILVCHFNYDKQYEKKDFRICKECLNIEELK